MQLQPATHALLEVQDIDGVDAMHVPACQQRQVPESHRLGGGGGQAGPASHGGRGGGPGISLHGVTAALSGTSALEPPQSHWVPLMLQVNPSPQSASPWHVTVYGIMQRLASEHDCPPSGPAVQTVAAPATHRVPAPQSESLWQGVRVWHAAGPAEAASVTREIAVKTSQATRRRERRRALILAA